MLLPFLPFLLAMGGLTALLALESAPQTSAGAGITLLIYAGLPLLGLLLSQVLHRHRRLSSPARLSPRRMVHLGLWLALASTLPVQAGLTDLLGGSNGAAELSLVLLLFNFWFSDALAGGLPPLRAGLPPRLLRASLVAALRLPVPIVALMALGMTVPLLGATFTQRLQEPWLAVPASLGLFVVLSAVALPLLVRVGWGLRPLADGAVRAAIDAELAANGVRVAAVLAWPERLFGSATAGVIGLLPPFRYLLFSEVLGRSLSLEEVRSITAHEAAHVKQRHIVYYLCAIMGGLLLVQGAALLLWYGGLATGAMVPLWAMALLELAGILLFLRFGMGWLSRIFERQADGNALRRMGLSHFQNAIGKVAALNGIAPEQDNWHHHGIKQRVAFLHRALFTPGVLQRHDRLARAGKLASVALFVGCLSLFLLLTRSEVPLLAVERFWSQRVAGAEVLEGESLAGAHFLAFQAYERGDLPAAERYFRRILSADPQDARTQNNLAWLLVTRPDAPQRLLAEGLSLAESASAEMREAFVWDTLAEAYFRNRRPADAVRAAAEALRMAEQGQGRGEESVQYYEGRLQDFTRQAQGA